MKAQSTRLLSLRNELQDLDNEIRDIHQFLDENSDDQANQFSISINNNIQKRRSFVAKPQDSRLYRESVEILEKRTHQTNNFLNDSDTFIPPKKKFHLKNYKPPSQRIDESRIRRSQSVKRVREQNEKEFQQEYTFRPKIIHRKEVDQTYDPDHLLRPAPKRFDYENNNLSETPKRTIINKRSEQIAERVQMENGDDFYGRQFRRKRSQSVQRVPETVTPNSTKKLTKKEEQEMLDHLMKPRKVYTLKDQIEDETPRKKIKSNPTVFEHLVQQSLRKEEAIPEEPLILPKMNPRSRKLTENKQVNLYQQSLESKVKREKLAEEQRNFEEMQKLNECTFRPKIIKRTAKQEQQQRMPARIAGMNDFLERMRKRQIEEPEEIKPIPRVKKGAVLQKPFSFDRRVTLTTKPDEKEVDNVLSEINQLLAIV